MRTIFLIIILSGAVLRPALSQTNFAVLASDGAWTWYNDPRALVHNGILYFGYVRGSDGRGALSAFNPQTGAATELWSSVLTQKDDHNNPGLLAKQDGTMLAIYARHGTDKFFSYRLSTSTNPVTPADWSAEQLMTNTSAGVTYANPFQLSAESGKIYDFTRNLNFNPTVLTSTNGGASWSAPQLFIKNGGGSVRPYVKYASDYNQRIDFLYTDGHPRNVTNSLYHLYYQAGAFRKTDGAFVTNFSDLPILHDAGQRGSVIYQYSDAPTNDANDHIPTGRAWCWETAYQTNGNPVCVFTVQRDQVMGTNWFDDRIYYYYARWTGTNWQKRFIAHAGRPLYQSEDDYAGGTCIDPKNPNTIYISSNAQNPFDLSNTTNVALRANNRYELYRGTTTNGGLSFAWEAVTTNSTKDNLRPYIPRGQTNAPPAVIWFRGTYTTFTSYNCEVVGFFLNKIPEPIRITVTNPSVDPLALADFSNELKLAAALDDDDLPQPATLLWTTVSGPANAVFSNPNELTTTARFPTNGFYVLRLTAADTITTDSDDVTVSVGDNGADASDILRALWLKLDSSSGTTATDSSGNENHGALSGGTIWHPTEGIRNGAIEFDGTTGEIVVPDAAALDNTSAFTLAYWFFAKNFPPDSAGLVAKRNSVADNNAYTMYLKNDRRIYVDIDTANNRFSSSILYNTGQWYHVALVFDGSLASGERAKLWINGQLDTTTTESSASIPNYNSSLRIGNTHPGAVNWLDGFVDDVRFYQRVLATNEIIALALTNFAPRLSSLTITPATNRVSAMLNANMTVIGGGNPPSTEWNKIFGAGEASFDNPSALATSVTFNKSGNYTLQLSANNGQIEVAQNLPLFVAPNTNVFEDWAAFAFAGETNFSIIGANADPDGDRVGNFAEFALGMNPNANDAAAFQPGQPGLPIGKIVNVSGTNYFALLLKRPVGRIGVGYDVNVSEEFQSWTPVNSSAPLNNGDATETLTYRDSIPANVAPHRFMHLNPTSF